ncbi:MAG: N-acetylmuramoyl-L-alanine amidase family protein [Anaerotignaceae bacterium]
MKYIVVHFTANNGDTALGNTNYFKSYRGASAHYFVDENSVYQSVEDKNIAWHCGAKKYKHSTCRNSNSIGVELCSRKDSNGNYYFKDKTVDNAVETVKMLMVKYNVPIANVIRRYDVTGKVCPEPFVRNNKEWNDFKNRIVEEEKVVKQNIKINGKVKSVDAINKDGYTYVKIRDLSDILNIGYDKNTKLISVGIK